MYFDIKIHILCELSQNLFLALELTVCKNRYFYMYFIEKHGKERISGKWVSCKTFKDPKAFFDIIKNIKSIFLENLKLIF